MKTILLLCFAYICIGNAQQLEDTCPDFSQSDENPWCLNCTFFEERLCLKDDGAVTIAYTYKKLKCPNSVKPMCILPVSWKLFHKSFSGPLDFFPFQQYTTIGCFEYRNQVSNPTCANCSIVKDDYCLYDQAGVVCQTREYKCPEYKDGGCYNFHNCTAPSLNNVPDFIPKLGLDGKEKLEHKKECKHQDITPLKENTGCINCEYIDTGYCKSVTKYTITTYNYFEFKCPLNGGKMCLLPQESTTYYSEGIEGVTICPEETDNPICQNCTKTDVDSIICTKVSKMYGWEMHAYFISYTCPGEVKCIAQVPGGMGAGGIGFPPDDAQFIKPAVLASLAGAG